jgi:hypothetical protein
MEDSRRPGGNNELKAVTDCELLYVIVIKCNC